MAKTFCEAESFLIAKKFWVPETFWVVECFCSEDQDEVVVLVIGVIVGGRDIFSGGDILGGQDVMCSGVIFYFHVLLVVLGGGVH